MIDESLLKSNVTGRDGFTWWIGRVADASVWKKADATMAKNGEISNRAKVRIIGYHPWDGAILPEEDLPWAHIMMDSMSGDGGGGRGETHALLGGETAVGFFLDGEEAQQPVIFGLINRPRQVVENRVNSSSIASNESSQFRKWDPWDGKAPSIATSKGESPKNNGGVTLKDNNASDASAQFTDATTQRIEKPSTCGEGAIGSITAILQEFIALSSTFDKIGEEFIDPITNKVVDMEYQLRKIKEEVSGIIQGVTRQIRKKLMGFLNKLFGQFLGLFKTLPTGITSFLQDSILHLGFKQILKLIFCIFENVIGSIGNFIMNMFRNLLGRLVNGPLCAAEQFVSGIFAKIFGFLEDALGGILGGLDWLMGGIGAVSGVLKKVSSLAKAIYSFIGCDEQKCTRNSEWISGRNAPIERAGDNWQGVLDNVDVFSGISNSLTGISSSIGTGIDDVFGDTGDVPEYDVNGTPLRDVLQSVDVLTGGDSANQLDRGLGSVEAAVSTITFFGGKNSIFNACNEENENPSDQDSIIPPRPGFKYDRCIPPIAKVIGYGSGAVLKPIVGNDSRIFSVEVINGGTGYDERTTIAIVDNTGHGSGVRVRPLIKDGVIKNVIILASGYGFCGEVIDSDGEVGIGTDVVGIITAIYPQNPGIGYTPGDTIGIGQTNFPIVTTPGGGIVDVIIPDDYNQQFSRIPDYRINTETGVGAKFTPIMSYNRQFMKDVAVKPLVGITSVIDCPTEDVK